MNARRIREVALSQLRIEREAESQRRADSEEVDA
jgi:hypothetical protein